LFAGRWRIRRARFKIALGSLPVGPVYGARFVLSWSGQVAQRRPQKKISMFYGGAPLLTCLFAGRLAA
jgi:hypothetical protein